MAELTPMMRQYMEEKEKHPDSLLFFRLGDFYEMFGPDARTASRELDLALTTRDKDKSKSDEERIPMCGVPYHSAEGYIARLIAKGYKVSICEQMEDPALAKGLVKREIIRTVTPGTVLDEACLDAGRSNYLCGVYLTDTAAGLCAAYYFFFSRKYFGGTTGDIAGWFLQISELVTLAVTVLIGGRLL